MPHDVFISHSSQDKLVADAVGAALEGAGIGCWMAPRDIRPGHSFAGEITRAIQQSRVFILIFSAYSNTSEQVLREVQLAANSQLHIVQFRIANVTPNDDLKHYLSPLHHFDAVSPPLQGHLDRLITHSKGLLNMAADEPLVAEIPATRADPPTPAPPVVAYVPPFIIRRRKKSRRKRRQRILIAAAIFFLVGALGAFYLSRSSKQRPAPAVASSQASPNASIRVAPASASATPAATGRNPSFAFIDLSRVFREDGKTKLAEEKINADKAAAKREYDTRIDAFKKQLESVNALPAGDSRTQAIADLKAREKEINEFRTTREQQLKNEALRIRTVIVHEIEERMRNLIDPGTNFVVDRSGMSLSGVRALLFGGVNGDISDSVISVLNGKATQSVHSEQRIPIALVDMDRVFKALKKTKEAEAKINADKDGAKKEYETRADAYKAKLDSINKMPESPARDTAMADIKATEKEVNDFRTTRDKEFREEIANFRNAIVKEIEDYIRDRLIRDKRTMIFDKGGLSILGTPSIIYARNVPDLSDQIIAALNDGASEKNLSLPSTDALSFAVIDMKGAYHAAPDRAQVEATIKAEIEKAKAELRDQPTAAAREAKDNEIQASIKAQRQAVLTRITTDVAAIAKDRGYDIVFDSSGETLNSVPLVVTSGGIPDLTAKVLKDLGGKE